MFTARPCDCKSYCFHECTLLGYCSACTTYMYVDSRRLGFDEVSLQSSPFNSTLYIGGLPQGISGILHVFPSPPSFPSSLSLFPSSPTLPPVFLLSSSPFPLLSPCLPLLLPSPLLPYLLLHSYPVRTGTMTQCRWGGGVLRVLFLKPFLDLPA